MRPRLGERTWPGRLDRSRMPPVAVRGFAPDCVVVVPDRGAVNAEDGTAEETDTTVVAETDVTVARGRVKMPSCPRNQPAGGCWVGGK